MAQAAKRKKKVRAEELPVPAPPAEKPTAKVVSIASAVKQVIKPDPTPLDPAKVTAIHQLPKKTRYDFTDDLTFQLYQQMQRIQREEQIQTIEYLRDVKDTVEEELHPELLAPAAGAVPVTEDESERLAAYLAHHNPTGSTKHIPTVDGHVTLKDGTVLRVNKRQDLIEPDDWYVPPYGGFEADGLCFRLSGNLQADKLRAEFVTRRSQRSRDRLGKTGKTAYENLVKIQDYRPVPDVDWFLRNPDGKSYLRGDLNPYPPGIVPVGDELASHIEIKKEHAMRVSTFENFNQWSKLTVDQLLKSVRTPEEVHRWILVNMKAHDKLDMAVMRGRMKTDDIPWSYDGEATVSRANEAANDPIIDHVSEPQRVTASEGIPEVSHSVVAEYVEDRVRGNRWVPRPNTQCTSTQQEPSSSVETESVVFVRTDGIAMKIDSVLPEHRQTFAHAVGTAQPHAGITIAEGEDGKRMELDLRDRRSIPWLRILLRRLESDLDDVLAHIETIQETLDLAIEYRDTGMFTLPGTKTVSAEQEFDLDIERVPSVRPMIPEDLGLRPIFKRVPHPREVLDTQQMFKRTEGYRKMIRHADELSRYHVGVLRVWQRRDAERVIEEAKAKDTQVKALRAEVGKLRLIRNRARAKLQLNQQITKAGEVEKLQAARAKAEDIAVRLERTAVALAKHREAVLVQVEADKTLFRALGTRNKFFRSQVHGRYKRKELVRRMKGKALHFLNLGPKKERRVTPPPSTVSETPVNTTQAPVAPIVTLLPNRTPPALPPKQEQGPLVILPTVKLVTFENDPVMASLRRAYLSRLALSGEFSEAELKAADERVFHTLVA